MKLSIVIPVYNEKNTINTILEIVKKAPVPKGIKETEIVIIDDYSIDGTRDILKKIKDKNIKIVYHNKNQGKGAALRTGFKTISGDVIIIQDADLEYDPNEYPKLLKPIIDNIADVVYGSRFVGGDSHRILYFWHSLANKCLTLLSNMFSDLNLSDMETCYKVFRKEVIDKIEIEENRFGFEPEITAKIGDMVRKENVRVYEVGISYYGRKYEEGKKIGLKDAFRAFWCIFKFNNSGFAQLVKYFFNGLLVAVSQFLTILVLVELLQLRGLILENISYAVSIQVSIITGFILHSLITWRYKYKNLLQIIAKFFLFQSITLISFAIRQGIFYLLSKIGFDYKINTLIGIAIAIIINFIGYSKFVFRNKKNK